MALNLLNTKHYPKHSKAVAYVRKLNLNTSYLLFPQSEIWIFFLHYREVTFEGFEGFVNISIKGLRKSQCLLQGVTENGVVSLTQNPKLTE
jgi:hypothetical protein